MRCVSGAIHMLEAAGPFERRSFQRVTNHFDGRLRWSGSTSGHSLRKLADQSCEDSAIARTARLIRIAIPRKLDVPLSLWTLILLEEFLRELLRLTRFKPKDNQT